MKRVINTAPYRDSVKEEAGNHLKRFRVPVITALIGLALIITAQAETPEPFTFTLTQAADNIIECLPNATARVTVFPREEITGVDTLDLKASGLPANVSFTVFLTESPNFPFGATQYIGEFTTNAEGRGSLRVDSVINEAFAFDGATGVRKDLDHVVIWFADPKDDDFCFAPGTGPVTAFDGDGEAGFAVLSTRNFPNEPPLPHE
jgi:hypothetical protein